MEIKIKLNKIKKEKNRINIKRKKTNIIWIVILILILMASIINIMYTKNNKISYVLISLIPIDLIAILFTNRKLKKEWNNENEKELQINKEKEVQDTETKNELDKLNSQIEILEKNINDQKLEINQINSKINLEINLEKEKIKNKYENKIEKEKLIDYCNQKNIDEEIENIYQQLLPGTKHSDEEKQEHVNRIKQQYKK